MIEWEKTNSIPISPVIKNWLRYGDGNKNMDRRIQNWLFGTTQRVCSICYEEVRQHRNDPQKFWCSNCEQSLEKEKTLERIASKINISCAYKINDTTWEFRIWGWIPINENPDGFNRGNFLNTFKKALNEDNSKEALNEGNSKEALNEEGKTPIPWTKLLGNQTKNHKLIAWREFNSSRDTVTEDYLKSLLLT